jgi:hypothetical protein
MTTDRDMRLALLLRGIDQLEREKAEWLTEWKDRRTRLENAKAKLKDEILSGQMSLAVEGEKTA